MRRLGSVLLFAVMAVGLGAAGEAGRTHSPPRSLTPDQMHSLVGGIVTVQNACCRDKPDCFGTLTLCQQDPFLCSSSFFTQQPMVNRKRCVADAVLYSGRTCYESDPANTNVCFRTWTCHWIGGGCAVNTYTDITAPQICNVTGTCPP